MLELSGSWPPLTLPAFPFSDGWSVDLAGQRSDGVALVISDRLTQWQQVYPYKTKNSYDILRAFQQTKIGGMRL